MLQTCKSWWQEEGATGILSQGQAMLLHFIPFPQSAPAPHVDSRAEATSYKVSSVGSSLQSDASIETQHQRTGLAGS